MFKTFDPGKDVKTQTTPVNEVMVFGGTVFTGVLANQSNIKKYVQWTSGTISGGYYHSLYSTNYTSASAVELLNVSYGQSISSSYYTNSSALGKAEKSKMYRLHAKMLLGDEDERFNISGSFRDDLIFVHVKRSQYKDEIKKGSVSILSVFSGGVSAANNVIAFNSASLSDAGAESRWLATDRGDVGNLITGSRIAGLVYYNAGVIVLVPELFSNTSSVSTNPGNFWSGTADYASLAISGGIGAGRSYDSMLDAIRFRFRGLTIINQSNLQTTYYFCRALNDEFNYSSNPTFLDSSQRIIPTSGSNGLQTRTYITKVGLYGENQELLAVASCGEPLKKSPDAEFIIKVRLDS
jgi:hypothetical protein